MMGCAGWLVLCKVLFRKGLSEEAFKQVSNGAAEGWTPDSSLFAEMLSVLALQGNTAAVEDILGVMEAVGVEPAVEHFNHLVISNVRSSGTLLLPPPAATASHTLLCIFPQWCKSGGGQQADGTLCNVPSIFQVGLNTVLPLFHAAGKPDGSGNGPLEECRPSPLTKLCDSRLKPQDRPEIRGLGKSGSFEHLSEYGLFPLLTAYPGN